MPDHHETTSRPEFWYVLVYLASKTSRVLRASADNFISCDQDFNLRLPITYSHRFTSETDLIVADLRTSSAFKLLIASLFSLSYSIRSPLGHPPTNSELAIQFYVFKRVVH